MSLQTDHPTITKIFGKIALLKARGLKPEDHETLRNGRLSFIWGQPLKKIETETTKWRHSRARRAYWRIQDISNHLFLAVALAITPTECGRPSFDSVFDHLIQLDSNSFVFGLDRTAKTFFETTAAEQGYAGNSRYLNFMNSIFPEKDLRRK
jgi:hypothetical protein